MRNSIVAIVSALMLALPASACAAKVGIAMAMQDTFLTTLKNSMTTALDQARVQYQVEDAQSDISRQLNQIQNLIAAKVDALIVNPVDGDATPMITRVAANAGIPVVYINRRPVDAAKLPANDTVVSADEWAAGALQARAVCERLHGKGAVLLLLGDLSNEGARTRTQAVEKVFASPGCSNIRILDRQETKWERGRGQDIMMNWLSGGMRFDAILSNNDEAALGAINALKATRTWTPATIVAGIDATADGLASIQRGELKVTIFQNGMRQGQEAVNAALALIRGQPVPRLITVPVELVTPANVKAYEGRY